MCQRGAEYLSNVGGVPIYNAVVVIGFVVGVVVGVVVGIVVVGAVVVGVVVIGVVVGGLGVGVRRVKIIWKMVVGVHM